jgi:hypothetical protein
LTAFVDFHIADIQLKDHKNWFAAETWKKEKTAIKKIIKLKIIDSDIINKYYNQLKAAEEKSLVKKKKLAGEKKAKKRQ